jgi:predicted MFS family arabinose efflux permease
MFTVFALREFPDIFGVPQAIEHATFDDIIHAAPIVGRYMGFIGIMSAIIQGGLIRRLVPRFGETTLAVAGPAILALSFVVLCVAQSWAVVIVACAIMPIGFGINNPALQGLVSRASPQAEQGAYMGMNQSMLSLARLTGPVCAGLVFRAFGPRSPFLMGTAVLVACALLAYTYHVRYAASFPREARGAVEA